MTERRGRCNNIEFCRAATTQRVVELEENEPFVCPECSAPLEALAHRKKTGAGKGGRLVIIGLQAAVLVGGAGVLGYKLLLAPPKASVPVAYAPQATAAELAMTAAPDAPVGLTAPAEPRVTAAEPAAAATLPPIKTLLKLSGSNVMAEHLARRLAAGYLALLGDTDITTVPGTNPATVQVVGNQAGEREAITISSGNSASGFTALLRGDADIAMSARPASAAELAMLASVGDLTSPESEHVIGVNAVAVIVNPANRIPAISKTHLTDIVAGRMKDWSELGQQPNVIKIVFRDDAGGHADTAAALFPERRASLVSDDGAVVRTIQQDPGAIGLVPLDQANGAHLLPVASATDRPLTPTDLTVAEEDYPLTQRLYFYTAPTSSNTLARRFTDYAASASGQAIVEASGFVSLAVRSSEHVAVPQTAVSATRLQAFLEGGTRLSTTFRFQPGSDTLDNRALRDVQRLGAYLRTKHIDGNHLLLAGFADNTGTPAANEAVAQRRVAAVTAALTASGLPPAKAQSFGQDFSVADNSTADGREKNRRVEVYVTQ